MDPKGFEKKPWFPYLKNMYDQIEEDIMSVDAKGYEEKPWWPYVLDLQEKIDAGGGGGPSIATITLNFTDYTGRGIESYEAVTTFSVPAGSPPLDIFIGKLSYDSLSNIVKCFLGASKYEFGAFFPGVQEPEQPANLSIVCTGGVSYDLATNTFTVTGDGTITGEFSA